MNRRKSFWISLSLINLSIVALLGFTMRTKFLFPLPFIDYRSILSAHSHFAFGGWLGLVLCTLLVHEVLPAPDKEKKSYQWLLSGVAFSSVGMLLTFPFGGYWFGSILFSTLFILVTYVFGWVFIRDILKTNTEKTVGLLSISCVVSLLLSSIGPFGLSYILISKSGDSILYRNFIYIFLHFQYNGFFTLAVFALFCNDLVKKGLPPGRHLRRFAIYLSLSVLPSLFLSLLWYNKTEFYYIAATGCVLIILSLYHLNRSRKMIHPDQLFRYRLARWLWALSFLSFGLKMLMNIGTIYPPLGNAVYGDRPVIIGFLHLVFLAFVSFFVLSKLVESQAFHRKGKLMAVPLYVFIFGVIAQEMLLMLQGLEILLNTNNYIYSWLLWATSIVLFAGALMMAGARLMAQKSHRSPYG